MAEKTPLETIGAELAKGMSLRKCRKCGCMMEALESLHSSLPSVKAEGALELLGSVENWLQRMEPTAYT